MGDRNKEIWSTRLQREILALESSDDESKKIELLPPFIKTTGHTLNLEGGIAKIEFRIDVELAEEAKRIADDVNTGQEEAGDKEAEEGGNADENEGRKSANEDENKGDKKEIDADAGGEAKDAADKEAEEPGNEDENEGEKNANEDDDKGDTKEVDANAGGEAKNAEEPEKAEAESETATDTLTEDTPQKDEIDHHVVLVLDASLYWRPDSSSPQSTSPPCYPFRKPLAIVKSGSHLFWGGSTIRDGDEVDIDLDWTPSIHMSDAVTNVALKIRECIKRGEPLHATQRDDYDEDDGISGSILREAREAKESLLETKKAVGAIFSSGFSSLSAKGSSIAAKGQSARSSMSKNFQYMGESLSNFAEAGAIGKVGKYDEKEASGEERAPKEKTKKEVKAIPDIGDEIDLSDSPWNRCIGMYSCKAIKRPAFVEAIIAEASKNQKQEKEVSSAGSMFSRFAQSAKSVMEESFVMITEKCIVEFKSNRLNIGSGTVSFSIKIEQMAKLKFRREESLSLFFKQATDDPLVYMCLDSALAVKDIQNVLKRHGVKGKHTNASTQRAVQMALNLVALIQKKEKELIDNPTVDRVNEIMDLYRQAAEKFEVAGDPRHSEVMAHMKRFLNQQFTTSILDGTFMKKVKDVEHKTGSPQSDKQTGVSVPQGEILEQPAYNLSNDDDDDDDDDVIPVADKKETPIKEENTDDANDTTMQNMEDMLSEAVKDMSELGMEDDDINTILSSPSKKKSTDDLTEHDDTFAELDAMLSDADKELNELLSS
mmetsp:Transcript_13886/g.33635  ORF Transcript_13886/g.33635 Transcript_13886/m.33635 type:complete len:771 (-) Transcript_13886:40-2352(-)